MSAALNLHPEPGHPGAMVVAVHELLDGVAADLLGPSDFAGVIAELSRARSRLQALELKLVAAAERHHVPRLTGARSTGAWVAQQTRSDGAQAARDARLALDLDASLPTTASALGAGEVSAAHAAVIAGATRQLPPSLTPDQRRAVEQRLVDKARVLDPRQLRRVARRALEAVERDTSVVDANEDGILRDEEALALSRTRLTLHDNGDGTTSGHFRVPTLAATVLRKVVDAMTAPRRGRLGATEAQAGDQRLDRDPAHERGLALTTLLEHLPTDRLASKVAATVIVKLDLDTLRGQLKAGGLDTDDLVSAAEARRLACNAGLVPAVLDGASQLLDLGRGKRLFSEAQRTAGALRHTSCAADGCDVPYAWAELHHWQPWSRGGRTDLEDLVPLCGFHHRRVHDSGYLHRRLPDGSIRFSRRT
ncbi:HNH endonuclease signature motif containing protein [Nocardioides coralli]|uniref:HNH endonuclease signature motif containing protein n=1 Tax=Nocardioides coralli TaxID=2872154 RepID=UPI001CA3DCD9|nr:HNH endonuclease signature motif containing protein [Nocardioides coralli]QZY28584.1 HNH endonuclease [Nocardioides coralli]